MDLTPYNCPLTEQRADELCSALKVGHNDVVFDAGCGRAEFLVNLVRITGCHGRGIDIDEDALAFGRTRADSLQQPENIQLDSRNLKDLELENGQFSATICLGSTHAFADGRLAYPSTLERLNKWTRVNSRILVGECFWEQEPTSEYLEILGEPVGIYRTFDENIEQAESIGLRHIESWRATRHEWDKFERDHLRRAERKLVDNPTDESAAKALYNSKEWYQAYERWCRFTLGFGYHLFQTPD